MFKVVWAGSSYTTEIIKETLRGANDLAVEIYLLPSRRIAKIFEFMGHYPFVENDGWTQVNPHLHPFYEETRQIKRSEDELRTSPGLDAGQPASEDGLETELG